VLHGRTPTWASRSPTANIAASRSDTSSSTGVRRAAWAIAATRLGSPHAARATRSASAAGRFHVVDAVVLDQPHVARVLGGVGAVGAEDGVSHRFATSNSTSAWQGWSSGHQQARSRPESSARIVALSG
jgi:hypothetical protein